MTRIAIVIGSTRPRRNGAQVGRWVHDIARDLANAEYDLVDLAEQGLPLLDEATPASLGRYANEHTVKWADRILGYDGFVFVTPEYNHSTSAALKNAIDYLYAEWNDKAAGFVGYGSAGGVRAVEHLRMVMAEVQIADVRAQVMLELAADFVDYSVLNPREHQREAVTTMLDQVVRWSEALRPLRVESLDSLAQALDEQVAGNH